MADFGFGNATSLLQTTIKLAKSSPSGVFFYMLLLLLLKSNKRTDFTKVRQMSPQ